MKFIQPLTTDDTTAVILLGGLLYKVQIDLEYDSHTPIRAIGSLYLTHSPLTEPVRGGRVTWLGYPEFRQSPVYPHSDDGRPYTFICSVDDGWGDMGTANIFFLFKKDCLPLEIEDVYMEASCS